MLLQATMPLEELPFTCMDSSFHLDCPWLDVRPDNHAASCQEVQGHVADFSDVPK